MDKEESQRDEKFLSPKQAMAMHSHSGLQSGLTDKARRKLTVIGQRFITERNTRETRRATEREQRREAKRNARKK